MSNEIINNSQELASLYHNISTLIETTKEKVYYSVNLELVLLYWNIDKTVKEDIIKAERADYVKQIINNLSIELSNNYGKIYSRSNLFRMIHF
ncbi:DUF1016 N-terminal domain-containing protein [Clostridium pasteurianum]|uniref:DUF1016 N-terminal domain-containing protein n=1 Tax=Clostridium pasteurianum TaxID=1501 RepID=UPI002260FF93|nr:DUF1016 N-terminal domain-containing protein [Clostridium pasteurianum]UZW13450.1 DUF1016 N-terminal domain-containing protein [Clostridium pasteurianum]